MFWIFFEIFPKKIFIITIHIGSIKKSTTKFNCTIKNCVVFYYGGDFSLVNTTFTTVRFGLGGSANNTLAFLRLVRANGPNLLEELLNQGPQPGPGQMTIN